MCIRYNLYRTDHMKICKQRLHTLDVVNDFSSRKHWVQITFNFLAKFAEIFSYSVGRPLFFEH